MQPWSATVVIINDFGTINGGATKVAIDSAWRLAQRGHDVVYFCGTSPVDVRLQEAGVRVVSLGQQASLDNPSRSKGAIQNLWNRTSRRQLSRLLTELRNRPVVIHLNMWNKVLSPSVFSAISDVPFPAAVTLHDYFAACPAGGLFDYGRAANCPLRPMSAACVVRQCDKQSAMMKGFRVTRQVIQRHLAGFPNQRWYMVAVSDFSLRKLSPMLPPLADRRVLLNPNDIPQAPRADPARNSLYVAAGRFSVEKGLAVFAKAAAVAGVPAGFVGSGETLQSIRDANPAARLFGWLDHAGTLEVLRTSRALVFPSLWPETHGLVAAEAAALGIPVVVSDNTAAVDFVDDGKTGLIFPSGNADALADRLRLLRDDALVRRLGNAAYDRYWVNPLTLDRHVDGLERLYADMLGRLN